MRAVALRLAAAAACLCPPCLFVPLLTQLPSAPHVPQVAEELDRSPGEVLKKLEDIRNRII